MDRTSEIERLFSLYQAGALTRDEFERQKAEVLAGPGAGQLGAYLLLETLGRGGMGVVYRGRHRLDSFATSQGGDVAIKVIHDDLARRSDLRDRFEREADLGRRLDHAGIARIHELVIDGGRLGLVMELVEGRTLEAMIEREVGPIPWRRAWPLFEQLLDPLEHAHRQGVVHRDLKPANVMVLTDGRVKILDFGIARVAGASTLTGAHARMGTIDYMAPEQHRDARGVDARADVYALGMTLYQMLAGRLPWERELDELDVRALKDKGAIPSPTDFYPDIPPEIVAEVMKALRPEPEERTAGVAELRRGLTAVRSEVEPPAGEGAGEGHGDRWSWLVKAMTRKIEVPGFPHSASAGSPPRERRRTGRSGSALVRAMRRKLEEPPEPLTPELDRVLDRLLERMPGTHRQWLSRFLHAHVGATNSRFGGARMLSRRLALLGVEGASARNLAELLAGTTDLDALADVVATAPGFPGPPPTREEAPFDLLLEAEVSTYRLMKEVQLEAIDMGRDLLDLLIDRGQLSEDRAFELSQTVYGLPPAGPDRGPDLHINSPRAESLVEGFPVVPIRLEGERRIAIGVVRRPPAALVEEWSRMLSARELSTVGPVLVPPDRLSELRERWLDVARRVRELATPGRFDGIDDAPYLVDVLLDRAVAVGADHIMLVPAADGVWARADLDGWTVDLFRLGRDLAERAVRRIKVLADMDATSSLRPQAGLLHRGADPVVACLVVTRPGPHGERLRARLAPFCSRDVGSFEGTSPRDVVPQLLDEAARCAISEVRLEPRRAGDCAISYVFGEHAVHVGYLEMVLAGEVITWCKVLADLDITERRRAQNGVMEDTLLGCRYRISVQTERCHDGESLRLLFTPLPD